MANATPSVSGPPAAPDVAPTMARGARGPGASLLWTMTAPSVVLVAAFSIGTALVVAEVLDAAHHSAAGARAGETASLVRRRLTRTTSVGHAGIEELLRVVCAASEHLVFVTDDRGRVRWSCDSRLAGRRLALPGEGGALRVEAGGSWWRSSHAVPAEASCRGCHPGATDTRTLGHVGVDVSLEHADLEARQQLQASLGAGILKAVTLSLVLALLQVVLVTRPLRRLTAAVDRIRGGEPFVRVPMTRDDEIGQLGRSLDEMSASLARAKDELDRTYRAELAQSEKLAALGQLFSSVTHELKNQLAGITGALRVLVGETATDDPNHAVLAKVLARAEQMSETAVSALEFARPHGGSAGPVDLAELLDRTAFFVEREASSQGVSLRRRFARELPLAEADEGLMRQVFLNLLLNGVQAMPRGGMLELETRAADAGSVEVRISDQGRGILPEHRDRIFSPFFSTKASGTGLGLHVARRIVESQRGEIRFETTLGVGTTFIVRLPAHRADAREREGHAAA